MKIKSVLGIFLVVILLSCQAFASQLPKEVKDYLTSQKESPNIRFDGLVMYPDDTMYLPIFPANLLKVEKLQIKQTIPANKTMAQKPEIVVFNNNFSLLKVIRNKNGILTVSQVEDIPVEVRTGLLPQDMLVPHGLAFPANLKCVLGDVQIPTLNTTSVALAVKRAETPLPGGGRSIIKKVNISNEIKQKLFFVNNFQSPYLMVFSPSVPEPLFDIKTSGTIKDVKPAMNGKYLLVATANLKNIDVIDIKNEYVAKKIDLMDFPSEILVDDSNNKAYIACAQSNVLSVIDLTTMTLTEKIQLIGSPHKLALTEDKANIVYSDKTNSAIYVMALKDNYENKFIANIPNITKLIVKDNVIYVIARTQPEIVVINFDLDGHYETVKTKRQKKQEEMELEAAKAKNEQLEGLISGFDPDIEAKQAKFDLNEVPVSYATSTIALPTGQKPIDMLVHNGKVYVLSATENSVYIYNTTPEFAQEKIVPISLNGFSTNIKHAEGTDIAVIMNMVDNHYCLFDLAKEKVIQIVPINTPVNMLTVTERL